MIGQGDYFMASAQYTEGAAGLRGQHLARTGAGAGWFEMSRVVSSWPWVLRRMPSSVIWPQPGGAVGGNSIELTTGLGACSAAYEHFDAGSAYLGLRLVSGCFVQRQCEHADVQRDDHRRYPGCRQPPATTTGTAGTSAHVRSGTSRKDLYVGLDVHVRKIEGASYTNAATTTPILAPAGASGVGRAAATSAAASNDAWVTTACPPRHRSVRTAA